VDEDRALQAVLGLELGEQPVDVVDVPGALDFRDHDHVEAVADLADERDEVVEHPGRVEGVHARPQRGAAEVDLAADFEPPAARGLLAIGRDRVLEVAEQDVGLRRDVRQLRGHLLVRRVEEVDHPRGCDRDLEQRVGGALGERLGEVTGIAHTGAPYRRSCQHGAV
jgi:hypothetical protein